MRGGLSIGSVFVLVGQRVEGWVAKKENMTAIQLVSSFNGFGVHTLFSIVRSFQGLYKNFVFISVAVIDQGSFKGKEGLEDLPSVLRNFITGCFITRQLLPFNDAYNGAA